MGYPGRAGSPRKPVGFGIIFLFLLLAACTRSTPTPRPPEVEISTSPGATPTVFSLGPTSTPVLPVIWVWKAPDTPETVVEVTRVWLERHAPDGARVQIIDADALPSGEAALRAVVVLPPRAGEAVLPWAEAHPDVPVFAAGTWPEAQTLPENMLFLDTSSLTPEALAFLAGYAVVLVSPNWRGVALVPQAEAQAPWVGAFVQGGWYYCGLCKPAFPPFVRYPQVVPVMDGEAGWEQACQIAVRDLAVETLYLPDAAGDAPLACLQSHSIAVLRAGNPRPGEAAGLRSPTWEEMLNTFGPRLWKGPRGWIRVTPMWVVQDETVFTPGRQARLHALGQALAEGQIRVGNP